MIRSTQGLSAGWIEHRFESIGSTMDAARDLAINSAPDRTFVRAERQLDGKGRYGRSWISEPGNLYLTIVFRENRPLADCAQLSFVAALALADATQSPDISLKWPNDVLLNDRKTAGILLEAGGPPETPWVLLGMGVNVAHHPPDTDFPATHLAAEGISLSTDALCRDATKGIDHWRGIWHKQGAPALHRAWLDRAHGVGQAMTARLADREVFGRFEGLDNDGALILVDDVGVRQRISAGDVFFS